ncbi:hypothetical protein ACRAWD_06380 [Caulobacter segnis]
MFLPFYTTKPSGSGVGLSLSRQIIQAHGGFLSAFLPIQATFPVRSFAC